MCTECDNRDGIFHCPDCSATICLTPEIHDSRAMVKRAVLRDGEWLCEECSDFADTLVWSCGCGLLNVGNANCTTCGSEPPWGSPFDQEDSEGDDCWEGDDYWEPPEDEVMPADLGGES